MAKKCTFRRGIHIPERKERTTGKPAELVPMPKQVVIPINQHLGAPNKAIVAVGDPVKRGQVIADAAAPGPMTVPVHASIAGIVKKIETRTQSNNTEGPCIIIEADDSVSGDVFMEPLDPFACTKEEALKRIRDAGIVGMGGAGFPAHVKLNPPPGSKIDYIIADGAECEGYLTTDEAAISAKVDVIVKGIAILMKISGVNEAIFGMEDNKEFLVPKVEKAITDGGYPGKISVGLCKTRYPQGGEKMLITALTGREVPSGALPSAAGCIVQNVGTLLAVGEAFTIGRPLIKRGLTVSGGACGNPRNIVAPIGTVLADFPPEYFNINYDRLAKIIFGGPMMGTAVPHANIPVQKNTSGINFLTEEETYVETEGNCIRCGRCISNCSARLFPVLMNNALEAGDLDEAQKIGLMDCIECGACTFNCPARIRLVQRFRVGKFNLRNHLAAKAAQAKAKAEAAAKTAAAAAPVTAKV
ncbi:MAG: electron transport complex subunit RsxC [Spirochaetaceae bacterium]|jgi:electron transport complex protein RnfC|nr:electron transport complex subunit RsxC [Spirochaetaceae bacterium]